MKPFLGIDLTTDKKNDRPNGTEFLVAQPSAAVRQAYDKSLQQAQDTRKQSKLPLPLRIVQSICCCLGLAFLVGIMKGMGTVTIQEAYANAPWIFWITGGVLLIWAVLAIAGALKSKSVLETEENVQTLGHLEQMSNVILAELGVPANATTVDILTFFYKMKNGKPKVTEKGMQLAPYLNPVYEVFADEENLYLANLEGKYAFPLSSLVAIHTVKKQTIITGWNKPVDFNKGIYKQYKLTNNQYGSIFCKCHHILEVNHNGQSYGIYIPCYELPVFEKLTGLTAQPPK